MLMSAINPSLTRTLISQTGLRKLGALTAIEKTKLSPDQDITNPEMLDVLIDEACEARGLDPVTMKPIRKPATSGKV